MNLELENFQDEFNGRLDFVSRTNSPSHANDESVVLPFQSVTSDWDADPANFVEATPSPQLEPIYATIRACSWNIAAVNNNPFEYWITSDDEDYSALMRGVERFVGDPSRDVPVHRVFTDAMFAQLVAELRAQGIAGLDELRQHWTVDYRARMAIRGFLRDKAIGTKRLASLPDRITNTIELSGGGTRTRPAAINAYDGGALGSVEAWCVVLRRERFSTVPG